MVAHVYSARMCGQIGVNVSAIVVIMRQRECWVAHQTSNRVPAPGAEHSPLHDHAVAFNGWHAGARARMLPLHLQKLLCVLTCARRVAHADRRSFCRGRASLAEPSYSTCLVRIRIRTHDHFPSTAARLNRFSFDTAGVRENRESSGPVPQSAPFDPRRAILFYSLWCSAQA